MGINPREVFNDQWEALHTWIQAIKLYSFWRRLINPSPPLPESWVFGVIFCTNGGIRWPLYCFGIKLEGIVKTGNLNLIWVNNSLLRFGLSCWFWARWTASHQWSYSVKRFSEQRLKTPMIFRVWRHVFTFSWLKTCVFTFSEEEVGYPVCKSVMINRVAKRGKNGGVFTSDL